MKQLCILFLILFQMSCSNLSPAEQELRKTIDKHLCYDLLETVRQGNTFLTLADLRQQYDYLSVVYLQNGCQPCYPKFIEWQQRADSLNYPDNYSVLFVIQGNSYEGFMNEVLNIDYVEDRYYTRSEERRVGKECRSREGPWDTNKERGGFVRPVAEGRD